GRQRSRRRRAGRELHPGAARGAHSAGGSAALSMIDSLRQDLRYALRAFVGAPGFTLLAVLTVAIGVGANAAIFSVVYATLLRPLPFPRDGELVLVSSANRQTRQASNNAQPANFLDWRVRNHSFTGLAA